MHSEMNTNNNGNNISGVGNNSNNGGFNLSNLFDLSRLGNIFGGNTSNFRNNPLNNIRNMFLIFLDHF